MIESNIELILIYINEAHSTLWPIGLEDHPEPQKNLDERIERAKKIKYENNIPYKIYVDTWENKFDDLFRAWPDQYYYVNSDGVIIEKSKYENGKSYVDNDCYDMLCEILKMQYI